MEPVSTAIICGTIAVCARLAYNAWKNFKPVENTLKGVERIVDKFDEFAKDMAMEVKQILGIAPVISIASNIIINESKKVFQIVTAVSDGTEEYNWNDGRWYGSKSLMLKAKYTIAAGFDLTNSEFNMDIRKEERKVIVNIPKATILYVQVDEVEIKPQNGFFRKVSIKEIQDEQNKMFAALKGKASITGLVEKATDNFEDNIKRIVDPLAKKHIERTFNSDFRYSVAHPSEVILRDGKTGDKIQ